jgi:hypothetical protein
MSQRAISLGLLDADLADQAEREHLQEETTRRPETQWNPESFARQQIQGLVRQVFLSNVPRPVRQVVFSAVEADTDVRGLCRRVGEALAREASNNVAVVCADVPTLVNPDRVVDSAIPSGLRPLQRIATRLHDNLWLVPRAGKGSIASLHSYLGEVRREFEYSIVEAPSAAESDEAAAMAQFADGIVLVLSAHRTRRVTARKVKEALETAQARILGTVLSDRMFPMPEGIYRRL